MVSPAASWPYLPDDRRALTATDDLVDLLLTFTTILDVYCERVEGWQSSHLRARPGGAIAVLERMR